MFSYCRNCPINYLDQMGMEFNSWRPNDEKSNELMPEIIVSIFEVIYESLVFSVGIGQGIYVEGEFLDVIGFSLGMYGNYGTLRLKDGQWSFGQDTHTGATMTFLQNDFGGSTDSYRPAGPDQETETTSWILHNNEKDDLTIFSAAAYPLFFGASIYIGVNPISLSKGLYNVLTTK